MYASVNARAYLFRLYRRFHLRLRSIKYKVMYFESNYVNARCRNLCFITTNTIILPSPVSKTSYTRVRHLRTANRPSLFHLCSSSALVLPAIAYWSTLGNGTFVHGIPMTSCFVGYIVNEPNLLLAGFRRKPGY